MTQQERDPKSNSNPRGRRPQRPQRRPTPPELHFEKVDENSSVSDFKARVTIIRTLAKECLRDGQTDSSPRARALSRKLRDTAAIVLIYPAAQVAEVVEPPRVEYSINGQPHTTGTHDWKYVGKRVLDILSAMFSYLNWAEHLPGQMAKLDDGEDVSDWLAANPPPEEFFAKYIKPLVGVKHNQYYRQMVEESETATRIGALDDIAETAAEVVAEALAEEREESLASEVVELAQTPVGEVDLDAPAA